MTATQPDNTAVRTALWRALHLEVDAPPYVLEDRVGLQLVMPEDGWRDRPDMDPHFTAGFRASIVARARYIEDLVEERAEHRAVQYVILGAGLDTFAQRRTDLATGVRVFEVDQAGTQEWKRRRLGELGYAVPDWLRFVPSDFEVAGRWVKELLAAGFDPAQPAVVASTGVSMYLTKEANAATLREIARLAPGTTLVMSFLLPMELLAEEDRRGLEISQRGAAASGTPFRSFFMPDEITALARETGFADARHVSPADQNARYFTGRGDGLRLPTGEDLLVATMLTTMALANPGHELSPSRYQPGAAPQTPDQRFRFRAECAEKPFLKEFSEMAAVCMMDSGDNGVLILADQMLLPRKGGVMIPGPEVHAMKLAFEEPPRLSPAAVT